MNSQVVCPDCMRIVEGELRGGEAKPNKPTAWKLCKECYIKRYGKENWERVQKGQSLVEIRG